MRDYALVLLVTAAVTYVLTPLVRRVAFVTHAIHEPRARDTHTEPTPLLGGLAMYGGLVAGLLVASRLSFLRDLFQTAGSRSEAGLLLAGGLVVVIGFVDDRWGLSAISKLAGQVAAAGILVWSGQALPWLPLPNGGVFSLESDLSVTLTILLVVVTINAINFIDGLDGLAAGIVAVAALSFLVYSYMLIKTIGSSSQSLPAVASALLAGMCIGFLPHNFYPARIFMGDIGAMLLGLLLAYGPISSTDSLDPTLLTNYAQTPHTLDRFPTFLPLLVPAAIFVIPYADLMFAVIRRIRAGKPVMAADRQHLHHRLLNIGHSYRQSVLLMYLWAALFSVTVVSLSIVRSPSVVFAAATLVAVLALLPATMPRLRPGRAQARKRARPAPGSQPAAPAPDARRYSTASPSATAPSGVAVNGAAPAGHGTLPGSSQDASAFRDARPFPPDPYPADASPLPADPLPRAGRLPAADPFPAQNPFPGQALSSQDPFTRQNPLPSEDRLPGQDPFSGQDPFPGQATPNGHGPFPGRDPFPGRVPFMSQDPLASQAHFSSQDPSPRPDPFPGQPSFSGPDPSPRPDPFPGQPPFAAPDPFAAQPPFAGPDPFAGQPPAPFPSAALPSAAAPLPETGSPAEEDPLGGHDSFPRAQRPDTRPR
jgi:UDP-GlcNAc:undecaprenyl-phosphate GlcNAc-1-phosphate transferase